jgi:hypothetical protein
MGMSNVAMCSPTVQIWLQVEHRQRVRPLWWHCRDAAAPCMCAGLLQHTVPTLLRTVCTGHDRRMHRLFVATMQSCRRLGPNLKVDQSAFAEHNRTDGWQGLLSQTACQGYEMLRAC